MSSKKHTVVVGLGDTGMSCVRYFFKKNIPFSVVDSRKEPPNLQAFKKEFPNVAIVTGGFPSEIFTEADEIILSPGVSLKEPVIAEQIAQGKKVIGDIELFARATRQPIVGITGSNGKTTVTTLVGLMMKEAGISASVCGNIGEPVLDCLMTPEPECYVMELSSFQLETTESLHLKTGTILNVSQDHLDRYDSMREYTIAKQRIYLDCDIPVVNADEPLIWNTLSLKNVLSFGLNNPSKVDFSVLKKGQKLYLTFRGEILIATEELPLRAPHHLQNALACLSLGHAAGLSMPPMLSVLSKFTGLPHRCQWVRRFQEVDYYNDSKGTNVGATLSAIASLGQVTAGKIILIAGGLGKGADFSPLAAPMKNFVKRLILIGRDAPVFEKTFKAVVPIVRAASMDDAVSQAVRFAAAGDSVLLSPACASFDMFNNYEHRGEIFVKAVEAL